MFRVLNSFAGEHDWPLVALAIAVCALSSLTAVSLMPRASAAQGWTRSGWLLAVGASTGCGIWATHFIAMLAYDPGVPSTYDIPVTALSLLLAVLTTTIGFTVIARGVPRANGAAGGLIIGIGIAVAHYTGLVALIIPGRFVWSLDLVIASVLFGLMIAMAAGMQIARLSGTRAAVIATGLLMLAIIAQHFIAMAAVAIIPDPARTIDRLALSPAALGMAIGGAASAILAICLATALTQRRSDMTLSEHNRWRDAAINSIGQGLCVFDANARLILYNRHYAEMYGHTERPIASGTHFRAFMERRVKFGDVPGDPDHLVRAHQSDLACGKPFIRSLERDGRSIAISNYPIPGGGWVSVHEDVTERLQAERQRDHSRAFLNMIIENVPIPLVVKSAVENNESQYVLLNHAAGALLGLPREQVIGKKTRELFPADEASRIIERDNEVLQTGQIVRRFDHALPTPNNGTRIVSSQAFCITGEDGKRYVLCFNEDITERRQAEERLAYLAHYDQLTALPNRIKLQHDFADRIAADGELTVPSPLAIAMIDLDGFKEVNDSLGHAGGDALLRQVAHRLTAYCNDRVTAYRLAGDEFVLAIRDCGDPTAAAEIIASVLRTLRDGIAIEGQTIFVAASAGIAMGPNDGQTIDELLSRADLALYQAKSDGKAQHRFFTAPLLAQARAKRALDAELRNAYLNDEFELFYQPQVSLAEGKVIGAEALLRWRHPQRGLIAPGAFIAELEASPIAAEVGRWILRTACAEAANWHRQGLLNMQVGVNLFPIQFREGTLVADVEAALAAAGLPASALELEITENTAPGRDDIFVLPLRTLRDKGVQLAFDDFGTGYASLSDLTRYPLSRIKIDQSFVRKMLDHAEEAAIVRSIIAMAHNLNLDVIAEGVETRAQADFLRSEHCSEVQGYLYGRPMPATDFEAYLHRQSGPVAQVRQTG